MTVYTLTKGVPDIPLVAGMRLRLEAIDPTTGDPVTGVTAAQWSVYGVDQSDESGDTSSGPFMLVPGPTPVASTGTAPKPTGGL